jgi:hypothetical protein
VSWIAHNRLVLEWARYGTYAGTQQAVNTALGGMPRAFRLPDRAVRVRRRLARQRPPGNGGGTMTTLALAPDTRIGYEHAAAAGVDRAIRVSTAIAVLAVAGVAAYVSRASARLRADRAARQHWPIAQQRRFPAERAASLP